MQILEKIISFAKKDSNIRLLSLEGSRANESLKKDGFEDYDVSFFCIKSEDFINDETWLLNFGKLLFVQKPEDMEFYKPDLKQGWFSYLCLYEDGTKIDFSIIPLCDFDFYLENEKLSNFLLDKDLLCPKHKASAEDFYIKKLSQRSFCDVLNEFYHLKGYAYRHFFRKDYLSFIFYISSMREVLCDMLTWKAALPYARKQDLCFHFDFSIGKRYKNLKHYIDKKEYKKLLKTYKLGKNSLNLKSLTLIEKLFKSSYKKVAKGTEFKIPPYEKSINKYIKKLRDMKNNIRGFKE